jgi:hypothetical protein
MPSICYARVMLCTFEMNEIHAIASYSIHITHYSVGKWNAVEYYKREVILHIYLKRSLIRTSFIVRLFCFASQV